MPSRATSPLSRGPHRDVAGLSLADAAELLQAGSLSPVDLTRACLERTMAMDADLNAFITYNADAAMAAAREIEDEITAGKYRGPLHGIPVAIKDNIDVAGMPTTAASALLAHNVAKRDAEAVRRLKAAGAIIIGKANLHEFAYGGSGMISHFGVTHNPWDPKRIAGGSSSGAAAAVSAGMCFAALGTDTAGSVREPASYCGVVGLKPTYGLVSMRGVIPLSRTFDHVGPIARTVEDVALVLHAIAGYDKDDPNSREVERGDYIAAGLEDDVRGLRMARHEELFSGVDETVVAVISRAIGVLEEAGANVSDISFPVDADRTVHRREAWAFHARMVANSPGAYHAETLRRISEGKDIEDAAYVEAKHRLEKARQSAKSMFGKIDVLLSPCSPTVPPKIEELQREPERLRAHELMMLRNTRPYNVLGIPAISVPCGFTKAGLPIGLQIAAAPGKEAMVLRVAATLESLLD